MEGNFGGGKLWWGETLVNLANDHKFAKVSPANFSHNYIASFVINILKFNDTTPTFVKCYSLLSVIVKLAMY